MTSPGKMTIDELFQNMPKMMRIADDLHNMTSYINDLRIITIVMVVAGGIGGIGFLLFKLSQSNREEEVAGGSRRRPSTHYYPEPAYPYTDLASVRSEKLPLQSARDSPHPPPLKGTPEV